MSEHGSHSVSPSLASLAPKFERVFFIDKAELVISSGVSYDFGAICWHQSVRHSSAQVHILKTTTTTTIIIMSADHVPPGVLAIMAGEEDPDDDDFIDNYDMLTGNEEQYSLSEKMVHHCGGAILPVHWVACKAVLAFAAGLGVRKLKTTAKEQKVATLSLPLLPRYALQDSKPSPPILPQGLGHDEEWARFSCTVKGLEVWKCRENHDKP